MNNFFFCDLPISQSRLDDILCEIKRYAATIEHSHHAMVAECSIEQTVKECPLLIEYLDELECGPLWHNIILFTHPFRTEHNITDLVHRDYVDCFGKTSSSSYLSINFPLENCLQCPVYFYYPPNFTVDARRTPSRSEREYMPEWSTVDNGDWQVAGSYNLTGPVLANTNQWHSVVNHTNVIRKSFCLRFQSNPWHLAEQYSINL